MAMHPDLAKAIETVLARENGQSAEFKTRFQKLIDNVVSAGRVRDGDVKDVLDLVHVPTPEL